MVDETTLLQARQAAQEARREARQATERLEDFVEHLFAHNYAHAEESRQQAARGLESALKIVNTLPRFTGEERQ